MNSLPQVDPLTAAIGRLAETFERVSTEAISPSLCSGRILAEPLVADRDSPALDVSAMDGYALRVDDLSQQKIEIAGVAAAGQAPQELPPGKAIRIFTGAPVPTGAELVVKREDTSEFERHIEVQAESAQLPAGLHIRRQGENSSIGDTVLPSGTEISSQHMGAIASFATSEVAVCRKLRVVVLNTGDELVEAGRSVQPWQIRDSNGPVLESWLSQFPWIVCVGRHRVVDQLPSVASAIEQHAEQVDAILLTGGVSMGDADFVPDAITGLGGEIVFHRLPIRPGKPVLGGRLAKTLIVGLPGNPVSVAVTARVVALPLLRALTGCIEFLQPQVELANPDDKTLSLTWFRSVHTDAAGAVYLTHTKGSGDLVSMANSAGFVRIPPGQSGAGPWQFYSW